MFDRISSHPEVLDGKPVVAGTRISVSLIREWLASGATREQILVRYMQLKQEDIEQAIDFIGSHVAELSEDDEPQLNAIDLLDEVEFDEELKRRSGDREGAVS